MSEMFSVILPTFNRSEYLRESLDSVLAQTYESFEVIVVNDGSNDDTESVLKPYFGQIEYFEKPNGGKSSAVNLGLAHARGEYIWVFDDDDLAYPDKIQRHYKVFSSHPEVGYTYSSYHTFQQHSNEKLKVVEVPLFPLEKVFQKLLLTRNFICGVSVMARSSCYQKVGTFDESLYRSQDYDMWIRLAQHFTGYPIAQSTVKVREHGGTRGPASDRFDAADMGKKQHQYHQQVFEKIYREIPMEEIFGDLSDPKRLVNALVERVWMMAKRLLVDEVGRDLDQIRICLESNSGLLLEPVSGRCLTFLETVFRDKGHLALSETIAAILKSHTTWPVELHRPVGAKIWDSVVVSFA
jgi:glycosyltransferase involved in cell wall biosynthesis